MKTKDFLKKHSACADGAKWALSVSNDMAEVWDALIKQERYVWLIWALTRPGVFPESVLRKMACKFIRQTPLADGRKVWDLLIDERSRKAVEVTKLYADGKATYGELQAARAAAYDAAYAARGTAYDARAAAYAAGYDARASVYAAARDAVYAAVDASNAADAARDAANSAQVRMIAELGNPFKERAGR